MIPHGIRGQVYERGASSTPAWFQSAVHTDPDLIIEAADAPDIQRTVAYAAENGIPVGARGTGHGATSLTTGVLLSTRRLDRVRIDPHARLAQTGAGATWGSVIREAARWGLAPLNGSAPTVGVAGYSLGGGIGPLTRQHGYAADHITALDVVTAEGRPRHVTADSHSDLFWAMRGGGGGLAIAVALEFRLFPVEQILAGAFTFAPERFPELVDRYQHWTADLPDDLTTSLSFMTFPDNPGLPDHIRGTRTLRIFVTCADPDRAAALDTLRTWGPVDDTVRRMPYARVGEVFAEPTHPHGYQGDAVTTMLLDTSAATAVKTTIDAQTQNCVFLQIHHLGGAAARTPEFPNAVGHRDARYIVRVTTPVLEPAPAGLASEQAALIESLAGGADGRALNFLFGDNHTGQTRDCFEPATYQRLLSTKRRYDPDNIVRGGRAP